MLDGGSGPPRGGSVWGASFWLRGVMCPGQRAVKRVCVCYMHCLLLYIICFPTYNFFFTFSLLIFSLAYLLL